MSKVKTTGYFGTHQPYLISGANVALGWKAGMFVKLDESNAGYIALADNQDQVGMLIDDPSERAQAPSGSRITVAKGQGSYFINHAVEVAADSAARAYATGSGNPESANLNDKLYVEHTGPDKGKLTTDTGSYGVVVAVVTQVPTAANSYELGIDLRI